MSEYESVLAKARKLAAIVDPANGAAPGEMENAAKALEILLARHSITLESISVKNRTMRGMPVLTALKKHLPAKDKELARLCCQCLRYVTGHSNHQFEVKNGTVEVPAKALKGKKAKAAQKPKIVSIYIIFAEVTDFEFEQWKEAFLHYGAPFKDSIEALKKEVRMAQLAIKQGLPGFINKHRIFPDDVEDDDSNPDQDSLEAFLRAVQASQGSKWVRKAGYLQEELLLS